MTVDIANRPKSLRKHRNVARAEVSFVLQKKKLKQGFPALFLEGCSQERGAGWVLRREVVCNAAPLLSVKIPPRAHTEAANDPWLHCGRPEPGFLHIHSEMCSKP